MKTWLYGDGTSHWLTVAPTQKCAASIFGISARTLKQCGMNPGAASDAYVKANASGFGSLLTKRSTAWQSEWSVLWRLTDKQKDVLIRLSEIDFWWAERDDVNVLDPLVNPPISMLNKLVWGNDVRYQLKNDKRPFVLELKKQQKNRVKKHGRILDSFRKSHRYAHE